ncbi:zinc ribbon-containing protein [Methyloprofundus sp.]|uniref:zinc ribbon-containing protein n=1 Tax=Methyloprofundus sp. TaxID=2020875 RepID=UPI003D10DF07
MNENKLTKAYNDFMEYMYEATDDTLHTIADKLDSAKEKISEIGGLSQEEINHVADSVSRDIHHAADSLADNSNDSLSEWLKFDIELLEDFALESFLDVADKTRIELAELSQTAELYSHPYKSGQLTAPGSLSCEKCGKVIAFKSTSIIPECPECKANTFIRT